MLDKLNANVIKASKIEYFNDTFVNNTIFILRNNIMFLEMVLHIPGAKSFENPKTFEYHWIVYSISRTAKPM